MGSIAILRHLPAPQRLGLLVQRGSALTGVASLGPHAVPSQQTVLIAGELRLRHVEDALFWPAGFGGEGEDLGG